MRFEVPNALKVEHEKLHEILHKGTKKAGGLGDAN